MRNYTDYLRYRATRLEEFANPCHSPDTGEFCETPDTERYYKDYKLEYVSPEMGSGLHKIVATLGDTKVAEMQWSPKQIEGLDVNDEHQRKGIARAMWEWGQEMRPKPKHSNDRTKQGDLWAKAIGGKLPRLKPQPEFAATVELYNACHDPASGRFCETPGHAHREGQPEQGTARDIVKVYGGSPTKESVRAAIDAIDSVHSLPLLYRPVLFHESATENPKGEYKISSKGDKIIEVSSKGDHTALTFAHEFGHYLDDNYVNSGKVMESIMDSVVYKRLERRRGQEMGYPDYLLADKETFARAYAQYIALRSGHQFMKQHIERTVTNEFGAKGDSQWDEDGFTPIAEAFDSMFSEMGLLKKEPITAALHEFSNPCHDPANGRFCETQGHPRPERTIPVQSAEDELDEHNRVEALIKHYGRGEFADEMGGTVWAMTGESSGVTEAAEAILDAQPFDPNDDFRGYYRSQYDIAKTILDTIESERSDVPLFSGHRRGQEDIDAMIEEGVSFPLVATSPDQRLAEQYAGFSGKLAKSVIFEFPPGTQSGFYQANEHIATGEFEVVSHETDSMGRVRMKLRQTRSSRVPEPIELEEGEE